MTRIEHFAIFAKNLAALKTFYVERLGFRVLKDNSAVDPPGYFLGDGAGGVLEIIARPPDEPAVDQRFVCHLAIWADDYPAMHAALEKAGIVFEKETAIDKPSMKTAFFDDPDGNRCQIVWRQPPLGSA